VNLEALWLNHTQVSDIEPFRGLTALEYLALTGTQVPDLEPLRGLTSLQELPLNDTPVSDDQVAALKKALPKLTIFR